MSFWSFLDEEIHRLKVQSPVDEVAELALDDIGKFPPFTLIANTLLANFRGMS